MKVTDLIDNESLRDDIPDFAPGDEVKVHVRVVEGNKERVQIFQGNVIGRQGGGLQETYTVRKLSYGVGVERTFPLHTPTVTKIEVVKRGDVRRAKLYYLRGRTGKAAKVRESETSRPHTRTRLAAKLLASAPELAAAAPQRRSPACPLADSPSRRLEHPVLLVSLTRRRHARAQCPSRSGSAR